MSALELGLGILATSVALVPILLYAIPRVFLNPKIILKISGQQSGIPIPLEAHRAGITIGITANSKKEIALEEIRIDFDPDDIDLAEDRKAVTEAVHAVAEKDTAQLQVYEQINSERAARYQSSESFIHPSLDKTFPARFRLAGLPIVSRDFIKLYALKFRPKRELVEFSIRVIVYFKLQHYEARFPWDMFPPRTNRHSEILRFMLERDFKGDETASLHRYGFQLDPGKSASLGETP